VLPGSFRSKRPSSLRACPFLSFPLVVNIYLFLCFLDHLIFLYAYPMATPLAPCHLLSSFPSSSEWRTAAVRPKQSTWGRQSLTMDGWESLTVHLKRCVGQHYGYKAFRL